jgi:hypothetical protein
MVPYNNNGIKNKAGEAVDRKAIIPEQEELIKKVFSI